MVFGMKLRPTTRRIVTLGVTAVIFLVLLYAGLYVRVPYVALGQGPTYNTLGEIEEGKPMVTITGTEVDPVDGHLNLTTVSVTDGMSLFQAIGMWLSPSYSLEPREVVYPPDVTNEEVQEENRRQMLSSEENATLAALNFLDRTAVQVSEVADGGPSQDLLRGGDEIRRVDGVEVETAADVVEVMQSKNAGDAVPVDILREATPETVTVIVGARPDGEDGGYLGITAEVVSTEPIEVSYDTGTVGGPSAGLMLALAVIDKLTPGSLTGGDFIAGTGTIDVAGEVGAIGGITHKARAAREAGATIFLVPERNCAEALTEQPEGLELIKVESLPSAVDALGDVAAAPRC